MDYQVDMGSSSESEDGDFGDANATAVMDSDEEEQYENQRIMKMLRINHQPVEKSKTERKIMDFEAEMEAELDQRAFVVEKEGGLEHQRSLSRSSSSSSLHSLSKSELSLVPSGQVPGSSKSALKRSLKPSGVAASSSKSVRFSNDVEISTSSTPPPAVNSEAVVESGEKLPDVYDKIYFDSDESEGEDDVTKKVKKEKRKLVSDDDLFYDPNSDAEDQAWVDKQRRKYCSKLPKPPGSKISEKEDKLQNNGESSKTTPKGNSSIPTKSEVPLPSTDAVLNCPACFTLLCMDCQRHELYSGQFRAMFVTNCKIDRSQTFKVPLKPDKKARRRNRNTNNPHSTSGTVYNEDSDIFFPVMCKICNTQVAMYDVEEIYHFFNILPSHP